MGQKMKCGRTKVGGDSLSLTLSASLAHVGPILMDAVGGEKRSHGQRIKCLLESFSLSFFLSFLLASFFLSSNFFFGVFSFSLSLSFFDRQENGARVTIREKC